MADNNRGTGSSEGEDNDAEVEAARKRQKFSQMERKMEFKYLTHWKHILWQNFS